MLYLAAKAFQGVRLGAAILDGHAVLAARFVRLLAARGDSVQDAAEIWMAGRLALDSMVALGVPADLHAHREAKDSNSV